MAARGKRILILGGGVGGMAAATRLRRLNEEFEITIVQRTGEIAVSTSGLPFYIGGAVPDRASLQELSAEEMKSRYRLNLLTDCEAIRIDRASRHLVVRNRQSTSEISLPYDKMILSPGAAPIRPHIPGMDHAKVRTVRTPDDAEEILKILERTEHQADPVVVLGGGLVGLEITEAFRRRQAPVVLMEAARQILIEADVEMVVPLHRELRRQEVDLRLGVSVDELRQDSDGRLHLVLLGGEEIAARLVIVAAGVQPEVSLALDAGLKVGRTGAIQVNDRMQTSDPDIYAVGDAVQQEVHGSGRTLIGRPAQAGSAIRQARIAADHLHEFRHHAFESFGGSTVVRVFGLTFACTGLSEKRLKREQIPFEKAYVSMPDRDGFLPDAESLTLKILFSPVDGKLFGAQAVGSAGAGHRIDILATVIRFGGSVRQLAGIELCYAPGAGRPKDHVHYAGSIASNVLDGLVRHGTFKEMKRPGNGRVLLDVRSSEEFQAGAIPDAVSMPLERLRKRFSDLNRENEYLVYSGHGRRGYLACRFLSQKGFSVKNFPGGMTVFEQLVDPEAER